MPFLNARTPPHIVTLVLATGIGALAINVMVPSLPGIARHFGTDYAVAQLAISAYLVATAVLQLLIGPASDRFGRRPVMLACFGIFLVASAAATFAPTMAVLLACRVVQAFCTAGIVLARAIVRDTVDAAGAASKIGYITMGMAVIPMVAPFFGGLLDEAFGWRSSFAFTFLLGLIVFVVIFLDLGETNQAPSTSLFAQFRSYPELLGSSRFWGYALTACFSSGVFFAFLGGGPYVATEMLGLSPSGYGAYFAIVSAGYMFGNYLSGRYSRTVGIDLMIFYGSLVVVAGVAASILLFEYGVMHPLSLFGPACLTGVGNGMSLPNANAGMVSVQPHLAGSASGLGGALQIGGGAALSVVAAALLSPTSGPMPLLWVMLLAALAAIVTTLALMLTGRRA